MIKELEIIKTEAKPYYCNTDGEVDIWIWKNKYITKRWNENGADYWGFVAIDGKETRVKFISN